MLDRLTRHADVLARALMSTIFIVAGAGKIASFETTKHYMETFGLPSELLVPTIVFEIGAGILLFAGLYTRHVAFLLAGFTLVSAGIFHADFSDQTQLIMFLKNTGIAGGLLLSAKHGATGLSVDRFLSTQKATSARTISEL